MRLKLNDIELQEHGERLPPLCHIKDMKQSSPIQNESAFTLIELLVVIAIIGILAALLLFTISKTKAKGQRIQCINNLHQQGLILYAFLLSNDGYPPWSAPTNNDPPGRWWADQLERVVNAAPSADFYKKGIWFCPSANHQSGVTYGYNAFGMFNIGNRTDNFGLCGHYSKTSEYITPIRESEVAVPAEMMAIGESDKFAFMRSLDYDFLGGKLRHQDKVNVLFCDGHVESSTSRFLFDDINETALVKWNRDHKSHSDRL